MSNAKLFLTVFGGRVKPLLLATGWVRHGWECVVQAHALRRFLDEARGEKLMLAKEYERVNDRGYPRCYDNQARSGDEFVGGVLDIAPMRWRRVPPTKPGCYFHRGTKGDPEISCDWFFLDDDGHLTDGISHPSEFVGWLEWAGPVRPRAKRKAAR